MSKPRSTVPTLTEVIEVQTRPAPLDTGPAPLPPESAPMELPPGAPVDAGAAIAAQVLEVLRPRIDALLEAHVRAALAPQVLRLAEETAQRIRDELAGALQALVVQAVNDALARRGDRDPADTR